MNGSVVVGFCFGFISLQSRNAFSAQAAYVVQEGETLGEILLHLNILPLWGKHGKVRETWLLNRSVLRNEGDLVYPGTKIILPLPAPRLARLENANRAPAEVSAPTPHASPDVPASATPTAPLDRDVPHRLSLSLGYGFTELSANDPVSGDSAKLTSSHDVRITALWAQEWSESFESFLQFGLRAIDFDPSSNPNKTLSGSSNVPAHLAVGAQTSFGSRLSLRYFVGYGQELFIRGLNSNTLSVDQAALVSGTAELDAKVYQRASTTIGAKASGIYLGVGSTDSYSIHSGSLLGGGLYLEKGTGASSSSHLRFDLDFSERKQNTSVTNQSESVLLGSLTFSFPFLGGGDHAP